MTYPQTTFSNEKSIKSFLIVIVFLITFIINILSLIHKSITCDEYTHFAYSAKVFSLNLDRGLKYNSSMPMNCLNAIPCIIGYIIKYFFKSDGIKEILCSFNAARCVTILFSLLLAFYVYRWSKELYGDSAGIFSLMIYAFSPNIIAHSGLVTTDLYAACFITISTYHFGKFCKFGGFKNGIASAITLGLAQIPKYTGVYLYPIYALILIWKYSGKEIRLLKEGDFYLLKIHAKYFFKYLLIFITASILIINIGFVFTKTFTPLNQYQFRSNLFKTLQSIPILRSIPMPFPYPYIDGMDWVKELDKSGGANGNLYLLGKLQKHGEEYKGFKGYFFYAFLFKEPIAIQIFILASIIAYLLHFRRNSFMDNELFLFCPTLFFTIYFNFFFKTQIGIRFFLVVFPFLYIFCGYLVRNWKFFGIKSKVPISVLMIYLVVSVLSYFPHYISYFNELVWDRKQAYQILADSNIDWGQNVWYLQEYKKKHTGINFEPSKPISGKIVVGVNQLVGVTIDPERYRWLRENFKPVDHIAYSYLVYDIPPEALNKLHR